MSFLGGGSSGGGQTQTQTQAMHNQTQKSPNTPKFKSNFSCQYRTGGFFRELRSARVFDPAAQLFIYVREL